MPSRAFVMARRRVCYLASPSSYRPLMISILLETEAVS